MKPYKMVSMAMYALFFLAMLYHVKFVFDKGESIILVMDSVFSFIFPAFIFFIVWFISFKRKEEKESLLSFYSKLLLNVVFPYFICMAPYIVYNYGVNNLEFGELIKIVSDFNISGAFSYVRSLMSILFIYPILEYLVKLNGKAAIIISFIISAISASLNLSDIIYTDCLNYLIYASLGVFVTYYGKDSILFLRKEKYLFKMYFIETAALLYVVTRFDLYNFFVPFVTMLYSLSFICFLEYFCYRAKFLFYKNKKYLITSKFFNPPVIAVSTFLLAQIISVFWSRCINFSGVNMSFKVRYVVLIGCLIAVVLASLSHKKYMKKHFRQIGEWY